MKERIGAVGCEFKYSGVGNGLLFGAVLATLALVACTPLGLALRGFMALYVAALGWRARRVLNSTRGIRVDGEGVIAVVTAQGERTGVVRDGSFVAPWLTIVRWRPEGARWDRTVAIFPDTANADARRRLRVLLRWR
jgi:toxin CptA